MNSKNPKPFQFQDLTWGVEWEDGSVSRMPDEQTARRCAAVGKLVGACKESLDLAVLGIGSVPGPYYTDEQREHCDKCCKEAKEIQDRIRSALTLARETT